MAHLFVEYMLIFNSSGGEIFADKYYNPFSKKYYSLPYETAKKNINYYSEDKTATIQTLFDDYTQIEIDGKNFYSAIKNEWINIKTTDEGDIIIVKIAPTINERKLTIGLYSRDIPILLLFIYQSADR